ncbi:MAG: CotH kinase family protein [Ruminococcus sp.]|nr:CotH kinase family protein [Ruminococcus sp.]
MKKILSFLLLTVLVFSLFNLCSFTASAEEANDDSTGNILVPQIRVTTENGSGTTLQKADGYVNADITIADTDGSVLTDAVQFKVRGNSTALTSVAKKAFTFKFAKKKDVLGMGKGKKWALLANAFDPTLMRNYIALDFAREMGLKFTSQQRYVELWVDDSYRGCYVLTEPVQEGTDRVDIDIESNDGMKDFLIEREATRSESDVTYFKTDGIRFAVSEPEEPNADQLAYIQSTMDEIMAVIKSGDRDVIAERIDIPSFTRFYLLNELYKTVDFDFSSVFFYCKDGVLYAGPAWDYDLAAGNGNANYSATARASTETDGLFAAERHLYKYLCSYDWFNDEICAAYNEYSGYIENIYSEGGLMDELLNDYGELFSRNFNDAGWSPAKWWVNVQRRPDTAFDANVDYLRSWLRDRNEWLSAYYALPAETHMIGDADGDGVVTILDATVIQRVLVDFTVPSFNEKAADVDGDGLDITDATKIQRFLAELIDPYHVGEMS